MLRDGSTVHLRPVRARRRGGAARLFRRARPPFAGLPLLLRRRRPRPGRADDGQRRLQGPLRPDRRPRRRAPPARPRHLPRARPTAGPKSPSRSPPRCRAMASARSCSPTSPRSRQENGIATFVAEVMPQNHRMIEMFRRSGFPVEIDASAEGLSRRAPDLALDGGGRALRGPRPPGGEGGDRSLPRAALDRRRRRLAPARQRSAARCCTT